MELPLKHRALQFFRFTRSAIYLPVMLFFLLGCSKDPEFTPVYNVPVEIQPFVDAFIQEANDRGYPMEITNLIIKYDPEMSDPHCAHCSSASLSGDIQKIISINPNFNCVFTDEEHEALLFHELGHCILGRLHADDFLPNGNFKSVMNANDLSVYSSCIYPIDDQPCDNRFKRPYYLDELFDESTSVPDWGK